MFLKKKKNQKPNQTLLSVNHFEGGVRLGVCPSGGAAERRPLRGDGLPCILCAVRALQLKTHSVQGLLVNVLLLEM